MNTMEDSHDNDFALSQRCFRTEDQSENIYLDIISEIAGSYMIMIKTTI